MAAKMHARARPGEILHRIDQLEQPQGVAVLSGMTRRGVQRENTVGIGQRIFQAPEHQRHRNAGFVVDIGEKLRLQLIELRQFLALARNLALTRLHLGDVVSLGCDEHDVALLILDRPERGVDNDRLLAAAASVDFRIPANEFALRGAPTLAQDGTLSVPHF